MKIIVATGNKGKLKEIKEIFSLFDVVSNKEAGFDIKVEEDADSFAGNAIKKAKAIAEASGEISLGDDSGIQIDYFNGWPGVKTARWMEGTDHEKNLAILEKMKDVPKEQRTAHVVTTIAVVDGENHYFVGEHVLDGIIATEPRGENGFGFDEIFELPCGKTLAEISSEEKNEISPRKKALEKVIRMLKS